MRKINKVFSALLVIVLISTFFTVSGSAEQYMTSQSKADILNKLDILIGTGDDYNLAGQLKRSEAAAFIVRLLGKEDFVFENKDQFKNTIFPDVPSTQWYAPYIGYCAFQNIIAGDTSGNYRPDSYVSEKEFLKLVLGVLGYECNTDYTWSEVYRQAYSTGLVNGNEYLDKTSDNLHFTREDAVNVMHSALTKKLKGEETTLIQSLIDNGAVDKDTALSAGLLDSGDAAVSITQAVSSGKNMVILVFSEPVSTVSTDQIKIYRQDDIEDELQVTAVTQNEGTLVIYTSDQTEYVNYIIEISGIRDSNGNFIDKLAESFTGYRPAELNSDFFRVSKVVPTSKSTLDIYFTHPVNSNCELASYYEISDSAGVFASGSSQALTAKLKGTDTKVISLYLNGKVFEQDTQYTLKVSGDVTSVYGVKLNEGEGDSVKFTGVSTEDEGLKLLGITPIDYKTVKLQFNKEINPVRAQQVFSYYITDSSNNPIAISKATVGYTGTDAGKAVYLTVSGVLAQNQSYKIMINEINDITRQYSITEEQYTFTGNYPSTSQILSIDSVRALDRSTVAVYFNRPLNETTALTREYYTISGMTHTGYYATPASIIFDADSNPNMVKIFLPADKTLLAGKTYKLTVLGAMQDFMGTPALVNREYTFAGSGLDASKPYISDAVIISKDTIKVTFNREIALATPNILASNYTLEYTDGTTTITKVPLIAGYINSTTLVLKFDTLDFSKEYVLKFISLKDYSEQFTRTASDGQNSFNVRVGK